MNSEGNIREFDTKEEAVAMGYDMPLTREIAARMRELLLKERVARKFRKV